MFTRRMTSPIFCWLVRKCRREKTRSMTGTLAGGRATAFSTPGSSATWACSDARADEDRRRRAGHAARTGPRHARAAIAGRYARLIWDSVSHIHQDVGGLEG